MKNLVPLVLLECALVASQDACVCPRPRPEPPPPPPAVVARSAGPRLIVRRPRPDADYRHSATLLSGDPERAGRYDPLILKHAQSAKLNPRLVKAIIASESEFRSVARSPRGARGLMQLMPLTAEELGIARGDLEDPEENIRAGTAYLRTLFAAAWRRYGLGERGYRDAPPWVVQRIVAAYHSGPRALRGRGWTPRTRQYVSHVLLFYRSPVCDFRRPADPHAPPPLVLASLTP